MGDFTALISVLFCGFSLLFGKELMCGQPASVKPAVPRNARTISFLTSVELIMLVIALPCRHTSATLGRRLCGGSPPSFWPCCCGGWRPRCGRRQACPAGRCAAVNSANKRLLVTSHSVRAQLAGPGVCCDDLQMCSYISNQ